jgi:acyl-CoA reductase-like NAD-dependent aldehyde dehydrogenase
LIKGHFINGKWLTGSTAKPNINPSDLSDVVGEYVEGGADEAAQAIAIASVIRVRNYEEALSIANDIPFGLSSGICTTSLQVAQHFKRHAAAGLVMINAATAGVDYHVPFGGVKGSNYGPREQGSYAREFYTTVKTVYVA